MKRKIAFLIIAALALTSFSFVVPATVLAQGNRCFYTDTFSFYPNTPFRLFSSSHGAISDVVISDGSGRFTLTIIVPFSGTAQLQRFDGSAWTSTIVNNVDINCTGANGEFPSTDCNKVGVDISLPRQSSAAYNVTLTIFKNGVGIYQETITVPVGAGNDTITREVVLGTPANHEDEYTYSVVCASSPNCVFGGYAQGQLMYSGPMTRKCEAPCGPSSAGKPLGQMTASVPFYWAPQEGAASTFIAEAGKTFKVLGTSGNFTQVVLACKAYWAPSSAIAVIGN
jgi:hypothetical protein